MEILTISRGDSEIAMKEWIESYPQLPVLNNDYAVIRSDLTTLFH